MYGSLFAVPFVLLIVSSSMFFPYITGKNFAFRILVEIGFVAWALLALIDKAYRPKFSWILVSVASLVGVMFFANLFGEYAPKSFWSNFERMEGWVMLVHFFMYFVALASAITTEKLWNGFLNTALAAGVIMSLYALAQVAGLAAISQGGEWRVDAQLGNSTYLGVYMLFHMFIAAWLFIRAKKPIWRYLYGALFFLFGFILFQTGTRGTTLGLIGGSVLAFGYLALMAPRGAAIKKWALAGLLLVILVAGGVWLARDTSFVRENEMLSRFAGITLAEGNIRFTVWQMAFEGVKERPILGWGQENFSYVFNKYYDPSLYAAEQWYDRTHNIFFDWLIAGGIIGLLAYLAILISALWSAVFVQGYRYIKYSPNNKQPFFATFLMVTILDFITAGLYQLFVGSESAKTGSSDKDFSKEKIPVFTIYEQSLILGLLAAYTFHNLFVFDNLASWIFYAVILALIHGRVSKNIESVEKFTLDEGVWERIVVPVGVTALAFSIYFVNVPSMLAAGDIIKAYRSTTMTEQYDVFNQAIARNSFAGQEIVEQMSQVGMQRFSGGQLSAEEKQYIFERVTKAFNDLIESKPGDARLHMIFAMFYRVVGDMDSALKQFNIAESLSPQKQTIITDKALTLLQSGSSSEAIRELNRAFELEESNLSALMLLAAGYLSVGDEQNFNRLLPETELAKHGDLWRAFVDSKVLMQVANQVKNYGLLEEIVVGTVEIYPEDTNARINLAAFYYERGDTDRAIAVLQKAIDDIPSFRADGEALIRQVRGQ